MIDGPFDSLESGRRAHFYLMGVPYLIVLAVGQIISYIGNRVLIHGGNKVIRTATRSFLLVMQQLPISYFDDKPAGKLLLSMIQRPTGLNFTNSCMYLVIHLM